MILKMECVDIFKNDQIILTGIDGEDQHPAPLQDQALIIH